MKNEISYGKEIDLALKTWVKLSRAYSVVSHHSSENIRSFGLTPPQFSVIETLGHIGPLRVGQLCDKMLVSGGNMTLVLDNLEKNDFIERVYSKEDRRAILVQLTDKGKSFFDEIFVQHANFIAEKFDALTNEEKYQLGELLKKLGTSIAK